MTENDDPTNDDAEWNLTKIEIHNVTWTEECAKSYDKDDWFKRLKVSDTSRWQKREDTGLIYLVETDGTKRLCVPTRDLQLRVISECHDAKFMAHPGETRLIAQLRKAFFWPKMTAMARNYVKRCERCQRSKPRNDNLPGLQQPLPVPMAPWEEVSIDFMTKLPHSKRGNDTLMVVVDRLSKQAHFIPVKETYGSHEIANVYHDKIFKHHGLPKAIVSDRDPRFTSDLWTELWKKLGTQLRMSTADHPQTDGQTEVVNRTINWMLRTTLENDDWESRLPDIEFAYNSAVNRTTGKSPFEIVYGYLPKTPVTLNSVQTPTGDSPEERFAGVRDAMVLAQQAQKRQTDLHRTDTTHKVGDLVLLHASRMQGGPNTQRTSKRKWQEIWRGPYTILALHGENAYTLEMPSTFKGHPTFNIEYLKEWNDNENQDHIDANDQGDDENQLVTEASDGDELDDINPELHETFSETSEEPANAPPAPPVRRSERGRVPKRHFEISATESAPGGVKQTSLQTTTQRRNVGQDSILSNFRKNAAEVHTS
jgi:hypothetical protein